MRRRVPREVDAAAHRADAQDPQFEQLRKQTEQLLEQPGFLEEMSKAMGSIGARGLRDALEGPRGGRRNSAAEGDAESEESSAT